MRTGIPRSTRTRAGIGKRKRRIASLGIRGSGFGIRPEFASPGPNGFISNAPGSHERDANLRTITQIFGDASAPGLARQPDFEHHGIFAVVDSRDAGGFPRRGGLYRAEYAIWNDQSFGEYNFRRFDITGSQFFSLPTRSVLALRVALSYTNNEPGDRVPFYLLPYVGGGDTVRSFREMRFRDENAGVFNVELRHKLHSFVYVAGFADFGKVARDWEDINLLDLKKAYGIGLRAGTDQRTFFRVDVGRGDGGTRVFLKFTPSF